MQRGERQSLVATRSFGGLFLWRRWKAAQRLRGPSQQEVGTISRAFVTFFTEGALHRRCGLGEAGYSVLLVLPLLALLLSEQVQAMKLLSKDISKLGGTVALIPEDAEDLWTVYNLLVRDVTHVMKMKLDVHRLLPLSSWISPRSFAFCCSFLDKLRAYACQKDKIRTCDHDKRPRFSIYLVPHYIFACLL